MGVGVSGKSCNLVVFGTDVFGTDDEALLALLDIGFPVFRFADQVDVMVELVVGSVSAGLDGRGHRKGSHDGVAWWMRLAGV